MSSLSTSPSKSASAIGPLANVNRVLDVNVGVSSATAVRLV